MKKVVWMSLAVFLGVLGLFFYLVMRPNVEQLELDKKADFYVLTGNGLRSVKIDDNQLMVVKEAKTDLSGATFAQSNQLLDGRYSIFSEVSGNYVFSLDFMSGQLRREPNSHTMSDGVFMGTEGAYQLIGTTLIAYDKLGQERQQLEFGDEGLYFPSRRVASKSGLLYIVGDVTIYDDEDKPTLNSYLYIVKESDLSLVDTILLTDSPVNFGNISDVAILGNDLYYTVLAFSTRDSVDYVASNILVKINLATFEKTTIKLDSDSPMYLHSNPEDNQLIIEHDSYETDILRLTVLDLNTGQQNVLNLTDDLGLKEDYPNINNLISLPDNRLAFTKSGDYDDFSNEFPSRLYLYDTVNHKVLSQLELGEESSLGLFDRRVIKSGEH